MGTTPEPDGQSEGMLGRSSNRRGFLGWAGRLGIAAVGAVAGAAALQEPAHAYYPYHCCRLAQPNGGCPGSGAGFSCPGNYYRKVWECCRSDGRVVFCGECASTPFGQCGGAPYACSEGWVSQNLC